jgi:hypothetical protein
MLLDVSSDADLPFAVLQEMSRPVAIRTILACISLCVQVYDRRNGLHIERWCRHKRDGRHAHGGRRHGTRHAKARLPKHSDELATASYRNGDNCDSLRYWPGVVPTFALNKLQRHSTL